MGHIVGYSLEIFRQYYSMFVSAAVPVYVFELSLFAPMVGGRWSESDR